MLRELAVLSFGGAAISWNYYVGAKRSYEAHPDDPEFSSARDVRFHWLMFLVPFCAGVLFSMLALIEWFISKRGEGLSVFGPSGCESGYLVAAAIVMAIVAMMVFDVVKMRRGRVPGSVVSPDAKRSPQHGRSSTPWWRARRRRTRGRGIRP